MVHNHSHNRLIVLSEFTKIDPAGLLSIKYDMSKEIERRFNWLIEIINAVFEKDILKLNKEEPIISNASSITEEAIKKLQEQAFDFNTSEKKVEGFMDWLEDMEDLSILEKTTRSGRITAGTNKPWSDVYVQSSYQKGIFRARREMESAGVDITKLDNDPNREVDILFNRPFHADRAAYLYTRTFNELKGITKEMDRQLSNILSQGIVDGKNGKVIAKEITTMIPKIGINRARTIARTEIQRAHHQANINEYMNAQVQGVVVLAEWENGANPCPICSSLSGEVFTLEKIRGLIPAHPNCCCLALPFQPGIDSVKGAVPSVAGWLPNCSEVMHDVLPSTLQRMNMYVNAAKSCLTPVDKKKVEKAIKKNPPIDAKTREKLLKESKSGKFDLFKDKKLNEQYKKYYEEIDGKLGNKKETIKSLSNKIKKIYISDERLADFDNALDVWLNNTHDEDATILKQIASIIEKNNVSNYITYDGLSEKQLIKTSIYKQLTTDNYSGYLFLRALNQVGLKKMGINSLELYRGIGGRTGQKIRKFLIKEKSDLQLKENALSGYTSDKKIADKFGRDALGVTIKRDIPREDIFMYDLFWRKPYPFNLEKETIVFGKKNTKISKEDIFIY
ncbi:MAG: phage head morphogenesis protein [Melioribacteraceae bacterium]|jgi:SPP1 gp7 family putative phage head morphogenesis protein|nr:phage head morphogenesis protein [Melioribacteraceae bacterium]